MPPTPSTPTRRSLLRRTAALTGGLAASTAGAIALTGQAAAAACDGCLDVCWVDVKPDSCPNAVNPDSSGVLPVSAGWPHFDADTIELVPVKTAYDAAYGRCQDNTDPQYARDTAIATELCALAAASDRSATPTWSHTEDADGDGDIDTKLRFAVADLSLEPDDTALVLRGESTTGDCTVLGIDSVRVVGSTSNSDGAANGNRNPNESDSTNANGNPTGGN